MDTEAQMYPYPPSTSSTHSIESDQQHMMQEIEYNLRTLFQKRQKLMTSFQTHPYQKNEIQSQLQAVNNDIQYYQQQQQTMMSGQYTNSLHMPHNTYDNSGFPHGNGGHTNRGGSYLSSPIDSAIGTGMTTENHSVIGDNDDLDPIPEDMVPPPNTTIVPNRQQQGMMMGTNHHNPTPYSTGHHYPDPHSLSNDRIMHTSGDRVRMTMFPDPSNESEEIPSTQILQERQTNLQKMAQPSQVLRAAVQNLVNYQSDTELTAKALPDIINLLSNQEQSTVVEAAKLIHELSKKEPSLQAITANPNAVRAIIHTLTNLSNPEIQKPLAGTVHSLSSNSQGLMTIYNCGGIPFLVRLLTSQVDAVLFYAVTTIHNMLLHYEPAKMDVRLASGLEKMVGLLVKDNVKFLAIAADCLHILAYGHQDSKLIILASNGPALLVRVMRIYSYEKLLWTVSRLLKALSVCPNNKPEIVQAGGMQVLAMHLAHKSSRIVQNLLLTLRNLSDAATKQDNLDELLCQLIQLLSSSDTSNVTCSAGVLSNLTCNNVKNKTLVCQLHGVEALLTAISNNGDKIEILERCVCTLRHITSRHPGSEIAQNTVRELNGIPMLMNLLQPQTRWPMIKALIGLFRNLALSHDNHTVLREQGCIPKLWQLLNRALQESQRSRGSGTSIVDNVSMGEVVECSTAALHLLARDSYNRIIMRQLNVIPIFVQLLSIQNEGIQRASVGALSELALDPEGAEQIERENANVPLTNLLHASNEGIASYAAATLFCLSEDTQLSGNVVNNGFKTEENHSVDSHGIPNFMPQSGNPMLNQASIQRPNYIHYSNPGSHPGSVPGSQPFTPNMSEPPSGLMTPRSEFELPLDFDEFGHPTGFQSGHHSGVHTPSHPHSGIHTPSHPHSGVHTPSHPHSGVHTPSHPHSGVHTPSHPHSGVHTPSHPHSGFQTPSHPHSGVQTPSHPHSGVHTPSHPHSGVHTPSHPHSGVHTPNHYHPHGMHHHQPNMMPHPHSLPPGPGYHHIQHASYNPPSPALMDTGNTAWTMDTDV